MVNRIGDARVNCLDVQLEKTGIDGAFEHADEVISGHEVKRLAQKAEHDHVCGHPVSEVNGYLRGGDLQRVLIQPQYLSFAETTEAFRNGAVDAVIVNTAAPAGFLTDLETTNEIKFVNLSDEEIAKFTEGFPFYVDAVIPGGTYNSIKEDNKTFAVWVALMTTEDLPEDTAYDICKTLFEGYDSLQNVHAVASYMTPDNANAIQGVDYHPGALKYLQEQNVKIG